ncbi:cytochrome b561 domain-containing protein At2g30890-like isoform X2 [Prosopis cineraria]|uniref:cytochrome b561 domain-containing protein At2g30890-like isoform X2 n=1 Tax=Prosopis cineraria TaxID=364024 RepID=UPI002410249E|nr:cytochrome b561 domain-containing protein At2g30890-like isoform X2 [Prosopis cineraria]
MEVQRYLLVFIFHASLASLIFPFVSSSQEHQQIISSHSRNKDNSFKMNPRLLYEIKVHGFLLWASMGFLMPVGIIAIRLSIREKNQRRKKIIFYVHAVLQHIAVLVATAGAIMSIKSFNNLFNNSHQRIGVALYGIIWLQLLLGIFRPPRGSKRRIVWFFSHWIAGTAVSFLGVLSVYLGLQAYEEKTSKSVTAWKILFTAQMCLIVFSYLFQDKWVSLHIQGPVLDGELQTPTAPEICSDENKQKELKPESC